MGGLFAPKEQKPAPVTPPREMPDENSPAVLEAKRRAAMDVANRQGRASTIMTRKQSGSTGGDNTGSSTAGQTKRGSTDRDYIGRSLG